MSSEEENLSPEEKLLKVIQEGSEEDEAEPSEPSVDQKTEAAAPDIVAEPVAAAVPESAAVEEQPALKLKTQEEDPAGSPEPEPDESPAVGRIGVSAMQEDSSFVGSLKRAFNPDSEGGLSGVLSIKAFNKALSACIMVLTVFVVLEIYKAVSANSAHATGDPGDQQRLETGQATELDPLKDFLTDISKRPNIFGFKKIVKQSPMNREIRQVVVGWRDYARVNLSLSGIHCDRAKPADSLVALNDKQTKATHFVQPGDMFIVTVDSQNIEIEVEEILPNRVKLKRGEEREVLTGKRSGI